MKICIFFKYAHTHIHFWLEADQKSRKRKDERAHKVQIFAIWRFGFFKPGIQNPVGEIVAHWWNHYFFLFFQFSVWRRTYKTWFLCTLSLISQFCSRSAYKPNHEHLLFMETMRSELSTLQNCIIIKHNNPTVNRPPNPRIFFACANVACATRS